MRKTYIHAPIPVLPVLTNQAVQIVRENRNRVGLIINNYGTQTVYLYDQPLTVAVDNGFSIFAGFGLAFTNPVSCPQSALYAGQAAAGGLLNIMEIIQERDT